MTATLITLNRELTVGDLAVAVGTLALAGVTWWLAHRTGQEVGLTERGLALTRESIEAQDRPFVVATPKTKEGDRGKPLARAVSIDPETGEDVGEPEWTLLVVFENWGKGPAFIERVSVEDNGGAELVTTDQYIETPLLPGEKDNKGIVLGNLASEPEPGTNLNLRLYYRSASGTRYVTSHRLQVDRGRDVLRIDFRRSLVAPGEQGDAPSGLRSAE